LIALWKNYIRRGKIVPYVTGFLEIGFSQYGPTLAIDGTLRGINRDVFVKSAKILLTNNNDSSKHEFEWLAFRPYRIPLVPTSAGEHFIETASGFMVTPNEPKRICIFFSDSQTRQEIQRHLNVASNAFWSLRLNFTYRVLDQIRLIDQSQVLEIRNRLADEYRQDSRHVSAYTEIDRIFYWRPGTYTLELQIYSAKPDKTFSEKWVIQITQEQTQQLRLNTINMLDALLYSDANLNPPVPFFAYVAYNEIC
ncbi:MAG: hypothetical protein MUO97_03410, partial [Dehalococcoidia bacterium]|nr:hypothetical protein [Dehalococcoidia bacterium]